MYMICRIWHDKTLSAIVSCNLPAGRSIFISPSKWCLFCILYVRCVYNCIWSATFGMMFCDLIWCCIMWFGVIWFNWSWFVVLLSEIYCLFCILIGIFITIYTWFIECGLMSFELDLIFYPVNFGVYWCNCSWFMVLLSKMRCLQYVICF